MRNPTMIALALALAAGASAQAGPPSFTADTIQGHPKHGSLQGRLFSSPEGTRVESAFQGRQTVRITLPGKGIFRVLFPQNKTYMEQVGKPSPGMGAKPATPCEMAPSANCERIGDDKIGDIAVGKWSVKAPQGNSTMIVWWDPARNTPLRQEFSDGRVMESTFKGSETREGRAVERWVITFNTPQGQTMTSTRIVDPELDATVYEESPGGGTRELRNIKLVPADPSWFAVPEGYAKVDAPAQQQQQTPKQ